MKVWDYIRDKMPLTLRQNKEDNDTLIGLPYPYTVPCADGIFNELYYWDTYFTDKALFALGDVEQAKNNTLDILYLIDRFGYMPNGNRTYFLKRSQPPYAALMTDDVFRKTGDKEFLKKAFAILKKEYLFWMTRRLADNGLNRYGTEEDEESCAVFYENYVPTRIETDGARDASYAGKCYYAECESGWDFNPRFGGYCIDCNPVDLNSNLYIYETLFSEYEVLLGEGDGKSWTEKAHARAQRMNSLMWDDDAGVYKDYNYKTGALSSVISAASFQPYFAGVAGDEQRRGLNKLLAVLESDRGIFTAEKTDKKYQWAYPNIWAPCQFVAIGALERYGYEADAKRIASNYAKLIEDNFAAHGKLFEKYNGVTGDIDAVSEYGTPEMLGWTAGVYSECKKRI